MSRLKCLKPASRLTCGDIRIVQERRPAINEKGQSRIAETSLAQRTISCSSPLQAVS